MALDKALPSVLLDALFTEAHGPVTVLDTIPLIGGSINDAYRLDTSEGPYFLKVNSADRFPSMFEAEVDGLLRLAKAGTRTPVVHGHGEADDTTWLLLEFVEKGQPTRSFWHSFGKGLAELHRNTNPYFGLDRNNYIGSLEQVNTPRPAWHTFFMEHRLEPLVKKARDLGKVQPGMAFRSERLFGKLEGLFPIEPPALLHGDLWNGNFICTTERAPVLIDPAVYFGHREMDIAMTTLFGGFDPEFHAAYNAEWPLERGWEERLDLCNLYPLLVHTVLFGGEYVQQVDNVLKRFT